MMENNIVIAGLPGAGKSTFLAAFWHVVNDKTSSAKLRLAKYKGELGYINKLHDKWVRLEKDLGRTLPVDETWLEMELEIVDTDRIISFAVPDISGESFKRQWRDRVCNKKLSDEFAKTRGLLFFVHADNFEPPISLIDANREAPIGDTSDGGKETKGERWHPMISPTEVQLVDLLQIFSKPPLFAAKRRIAVILSAWDKVPDNISPREWIRDKLPLLSQYLENNQELAEFQVFGVSAQGGDYETESERLELAEQDSPSNRIIVVRESGVECNDITLPVAWAIG